MYVFVIKYECRINVRKLLHSRMTRKIKYLHSKNCLYFNLRLFSEEKIVIKKKLIEIILPSNWITRKTLKGN